VRPHIGRADGVAIIALAIMAAYFGLLSYAVGNWSYDSWMVIVLVPILVGVGSAIIIAINRRDEHPMAALMISAMVLKLGASFIRYYVAFALYDSADANRYDLAGARIADEFHRGNLDIVDMVTIRLGTPSISDITGIIYSIMGPSRIGGFLVYSWIGFFGLLLFHRALRTGFPEADPRRYALLVFFLPSLLFWPSSIGKESVMMFSLGLASLGVARVLERERYGWIPLALGLGLSFIVRPHVCVVVLGSLAVAIAFRRTRGRAPVFGPAGRVVLVCILVAGMAFTLGRAVDRILPESATEGVDAVGELLERAEDGTDEAGSEIESLVPTSPIDYPYAAFSVLFRPTLLEASSLGNLIAALETTFLLVLCAMSLRRLRHLVTVMFSRPYVLFCVIYTGVFTLAWSSFANLGALARQRVQMWPFFLVLLAIPVTLPTRRDRRAAKLAALDDAVYRPVPVGRRPEALVPAGSATSDVPATTGMPAMPRVSTPRPW